MMCDADLELSLALDRFSASARDSELIKRAGGGSRASSPQTLDSMEFGTDRPAAVKKGEAVSEDLRSDNAVEVEVSRQLGMRQVANIIVALNRMKHRQKLMCTDFNDHELLNIMIESVFEECMVLDGQNPTYNSGRPFLRSRKYVEVVHSVCTSQQRRLVLSPDHSEVHAVALQTMTLKDNEFFQRIVKLSLSTYQASHLSASQGQAVTLGIANINLYMSCSMRSGRPMLMLEKVDNKDNLETIFSKGEKERFLFFKRGDGVSTTTFESAKFRDWYISTEPAYDAPVEMCEKQAADRLTAFMVKPD